jgi:hypothetical protein
VDFLNPLHRSARFIGRFSSTQFLYKKLSSKKAYLPEKKVCILRVTLNLCGQNQI